MTTCAVMSSGMTSGSASGLQWPTLLFAAVGGHGGTCPLHKLCSADFPNLPWLLSLVDYSGVLVMFLRAFVSCLLESEQRAKLAVNNSRWRK